MKRLKLISFIFIFTATLGYGQQKYWIYLNPQTPVSAAEACQIFRSKNIDPVVKSIWLNAASAVLDPAQREELRHVQEVIGIEPIDSKLKILSAAPDFDKREYSRALRQINAHEIVEAGFTGKGIKIGIIDGGFYRADQEPTLAEVINRGAVLGYKNFIEKGVSDPYAGPEKNNDYHGTAVWKAIAGLKGERRNGLASGAKFYLARTDQADKEYRGEEDYWIAALEWMHAQGVRLVNSSLGYSNGFDNKNENYTPADVDGKSSAISRVANIATYEKGMTIVLSAGNDGNNGFQVISIPGDAKGVFTIGATRFNTWEKASYSSTGPKGLDYLKPDVSCYSGNGTSFSAPVITGLIACLMEAKPDMEGQAILRIIKNSAHLSVAPNNYLGYGVPDVEKIMEMLSKSPTPQEPKRIKAAKDGIALNIQSNNIVVFHKTDQTFVKEQQALRHKNGQIYIARPAGDIRYTTIATPTEVWEIEW